MAVSLQIMEIIILTTLFVKLLDISDNEFYTNTHKGGDDDRLYFSTSYGLLLVPRKPSDFISQYLKTVLMFNKLKMRIEELQLYPWRLHIDVPQSFMLCNLNKRVLEIIIEVYINQTM